MPTDNTHNHEAPTANPVFYRTYSRRSSEGDRETWEQAVERAVLGLVTVGRLTADEAALVRSRAMDRITMPSGRWLWVGGTPWIRQPKNFSGAYNCLQGDTIVNTIEFGACPISNLAGKSVHVVNGESNWVKVDFSSFGVQRIYEIKLRKGVSGQIKIIQATGDHQWICANEERFTTQELAEHIGCKLKTFSAVKWEVWGVEALIESAEVFCCEEPETHSFVLTDGLVTGNCTSTNVNDWRSFGLMMDLAMMGSGTGAVLEPRYIDDLPAIANHLDVTVVGTPGDVPKSDRIEDTAIAFDGDQVRIVVGDSRSGWVDSYRAILELAGDASLGGRLTVTVDVGHVRSSGERLKGFGGVANPVNLPAMYPKMAKILNRAIGRQLTSVECCLLIDEAAIVVVAGNVRRSAGMRQGLAEDDEFAIAKDNLWQQSDDGTWRIDPDRDALRMANHSRVFHRKPTEAECVAAVRKQFYSGEGAIQWAGEAIARANADLLPSRAAQNLFLAAYESEHGYDHLRKLAPAESDREIEHRLQRYGLNPCLAGETVVACRVTPESETYYDTVGDLARYGVVVHVCDYDGDWVPTKFYMTRPSAALYRLGYEVESIAGDIRYAEVFATSNHRFFAAGTEDPIAVADIKPGDRLLAASHGLNAHSVKVIVCEKSDRTEPVFCCNVKTTQSFDLVDLHSHNCGEIIGSGFHCNLSEIHLNLIEPTDFEAQDQAFRAGAIAAAALLHHRFTEERYQFSRAIDPIIGVSFTGLFDFFVKAFGVHWLRWWEAGRPDDFEDEFGVRQELLYLNYGNPLIGAENGIPVDSVAAAWRRFEGLFLARWRRVVEDTVRDYCDRHNLRIPNRCTTVQPAGCLDRSALRIFDQGLLYADEIVSPGSGETIGLGLSVRDGIAAETAIANQPLNLVRVTLANGRVLRMTPNHRLSVSGQWVRADKLRVGMEIDHALGKYQKVEDALLLPLNLRVYDRESRKQQLGHGRGVLTRTIATPTALNPELGYFLGCFYGNGAVSQNAYRIRVAFNAADFGLVERLQQIAERHFGLTGTVYLDPRDRNSRGELTFANKQFFDWMNLNGLAKSKSVELDRIPQAIRRSSRATILSFFCGLIDTDGCVRKNGTLSIDSASESFLRNLQQIGEAVGLSFSIFHNTQGRNFQSTKNMWGLCLSRMVSQSAALDYINTHSRKCALRPLANPKRYFAFHPYAVAAIERETSPDYSYDFAVNGVDDDDSWYWQGGLKSHNSKSLLTGASPGWHPPKAARFIRRITFRKNDPVALACMDYGYNVVPGQADQDESGKLLDDPFDPRCSEWLVEIPVAVPWADLPGADAIAIERFSALAQFDFYMQVQRHYTTHNCFARDTRFLTQTGVKSFDDFEPGDTVTVLNRDRQWAPATVVTTDGDRAMVTMELRHRETRQAKTITATICHRFPVWRDRHSKPIVLNAVQIHEGNWLGSSDGRLPSWLVMRVTEAPSQVGWCVMEPQTEHFTLAGDILTMNTSATLELREDEIEPLGRRIHRAIAEDEGYISAALLARFDAPFPRLPFEKIDRETYDRLCAEVQSRRKTEDFHAALRDRDQSADATLLNTEQGPAGCDSDKCLLPEQK